MMRVTSNTFSNSLVNQLGILSARQNRWQHQAVTGQRVELPADDPVAMRRALDLQATGTSLARYQQNAATVNDRANAEYEAARGLKNISDRARELVTLADSTKSREELDDYRTELSALIQQAVQLANQKYNGVYLFGGTRADQAPFAAAADGEGRVTGVTYQGNEQVAEVEVSEGQTVASQTLGANATGTGARGLITDARSGADFFKHLIALQDHLEAGDTAAIASDDNANLNADEENFLYHYANLSATMQRMETTSSTHARTAASARSALSDEVETDMAQTLVRLNETQVAYQAALQSASLIMGQSLLNYL